MIAYKARDRIEEARRRRKELEEEAKLKEEMEKNGTSPTNTTTTTTTTTTTAQPAPLTRRSTVWDFDMTPKLYTSYHPAFLDIQLNTKTYMRFWPENMFKDEVPPVEHRYERYRVDSIETQQGVLGVPNMNKTRIVRCDRPL